VAALHTPTLQSVPPQAGCPITLHAPKLQNPPHPHDEPFGNVLHATRVDDTLHFWQP
jgi:hypothetical protein